MRSWRAGAPEVGCRRPTPASSRQAPGLQRAAAALRQAELLVNDPSLQGFLAPTLQVSSRPWGGGGVRQSPGRAEGSAPPGKLGV